MIRLLLPLAGVVVFFLLSLATVRLLQPRNPKAFFLAYAAVLVVVAIWIYIQVWGLASVNDAIGLVACILLQVLICLTMWNSFYSLLWGFSGGLMYDLLNDPAMRRVSSLVRLYDSSDGLDRILARRLPNLAAGGYVTYEKSVLRLRSKGRLIAIGTWCSLRLFSLGMGGGVK